jgi:segregation and condensation protein A
MTVELALPTFTGPLDLLLHLIERNEMDITAVSLANVAAQYMAQVEQMKEGKVGQLIDFIAVGARLMVIKSRALLPVAPITLVDEEDEEEDSAENLLRQLRLYKAFKEIASFLSERDEQGFRTYLRLAPPPKVDVQLDLSHLALDGMQLKVLAALARMRARENSVSVAAPRKITIEGQIEMLRKAVKKSGRGFGELLSAETTRTELSVTLLAVLEMIKRHEVNASQSEMFGAIQIERAA